MVIAALILNVYSREFKLEHFREFVILFGLLILVGCSDNDSEQASERLSSIEKENDIVQIKDKVVSGTVRNTKFMVEKAIIENGTLTLRQGKEFFADVSVDIVTFDNNELSGKTISSSGAGNSFKPHIRLNIKKQGENIPNTLTIMNDYDLLLVFGEKENLGIPFSVKLVSLNNGTNIEGQFFATYKDIKVVNGEIDLKSDSFDTLEYLAKKYIKSKNKGIELGKKFGITYTSYGDDYPKSGFVGYEVDTGKQSLIKIQLAKNENGWKVVNQLKVNQIHQAHPVITNIDGNVRTVEGVKATTIAARKFETYLNDEMLIDDVRSTSVTCYLTKAAHKASCRVVYGLKLNGSVECHNVNYLLSNDEKGWMFESEILDTQRVDYNTGELINKKPFSMSCQ